jgi:hypothetical protein
MLQYVTFQNHLSRQLFHLSRLYTRLHVQAAGARYVHSAFVFQRWVRVWVGAPAHAA